jgi:Na+-translocating ferredoxin:NAD+ oxidoreductase RNF subunit RnfB
VQHGVDINLCKPGGHDTLAKLSAVMGVTAHAGERQVAIVLCKGDNTTAKRNALYNGICDCVAAQQVGGNGKACRYGCMGLASCSRICPVSAIEIRDGLAIVHADLCIGCGKCVATCPRKLIKLIPESRSIHVLCSSHDRGPEVKKGCSVGCIACTLCVKAVGNQGISMQNNLAVVDYAIPVTNEETVTKCPAHTIEKRIGTLGGVA